MKGNVGLLFLQLETVKIFDRYFVMLRGRILWKDHAVFHSSRAIGTWEYIAG